MMFHLVAHSNWLLAVKRHKLLALVALVSLIGLAFYSYQKYLDYRNVQDMKELLAAFEQLERDVEAETGESLTIEADCGSVGKFAESYSCGLFLKNSIGKVFDYEKNIGPTSALSNSNNNCRVISGDGAEYYGFYSCIARVRNSVKKSAESIFYQYDISPGRPF